jgi:MYXO-CTERM domain-containing protein
MTIQRFVRALPALAIASWSSSALAEPASSLSQYGITWTFDKEYETGRFATGDSWVVGPVTVVAVSPEPTGTRHGSSVNPRGGRQAYDDRGGEFATDDQASFPAVLEPDQSLVSSVSKPEGAEIQNLGCLQSQAVLTVVSAPQPEGTLRPAYAGTYKRYFHTSEILWNLLPNLPAPRSAPDGAALLRQADRPRIDHLSSWTIQDSCAEDNWNNGPGAHACYGREVGAFVSDAALYVLLDTAERNELAISMIQHGIDNYGVLKAGGNWAPNGGHHNGRKWPIVLAATLLNDCEMRDVGKDYDDTFFGEDGQTYYGDDGTALFGWDCDGGHGTYFEDGCSGSGAKDCRDPAGLVDGCADYRNCCTSAYWVGQALSALAMSAQGTWDHDPYFDFVDRWMNGDVEGGGQGSGAFVNEMWSLYRDNLPQAPAAPRCDSVASGSGGAGAAGAGGGAGSGTSGDPGGTGAGGSDPANDADGGCGCRVPAQAASRSAWIALAGLALAALRRAKRAQRTGPGG